MQCGVDHSTYKTVVYLCIPVYPKQLPITGGGGGGGGGGIAHAHEFCAKSAL